VTRQTLPIDPLAFPNMPTNWTRLPVNLALKSSTVLMARNVYRIFLPVKMRFMLLSDVAFSHEYDSPRLRDLRPDLI
jgi:hypothetical protein